MQSIWQQTAQKPNFEPLTNNIQTDVLIIGGGLTGILCGHVLRQAGIDCVIAEAKSICGGTTKNTTAKVTLHHGAIFHQMLHRYGREKAARYCQAHRDALEAYRHLAQTIDCDWKDTDSYVYSQNDAKKIEQEVAALQKLGCDAEWSDRLPLPFSVAGAVKLPHQAQMHPLKLAYALAKGLKIFENTEVLRWTPEGAVTPGGCIRAEKTIVATHFPFWDLHGLYWLKLYQHRSYVLALQNAPGLHGMYVDASDAGLSFRSYGDCLLLGGGGHRTGKQGGGWPALQEAARQYFPNATELCRFAAQDCKTPDDIAYIGQYAKSTPNLYVATGFNKWGMSSAMVAATVLCDLLQGKPSPYADLFSPSRSLLHKQVWINAGDAILGMLRPTAPRCSHLGCALQYNRQEHSWDCSCHGSRFTADGRVIDNPAKKGIHPKKPPHKPHTP